MSKKYTVLEYGLSVLMSQIQRRITAVTLFPTLERTLKEIDRSRYQVQVKPHPAPA